MARDIRVNSSDCFDRNKYFKKIKGEINKFEDICSGVFYSKDLVALTQTKNIVNGRVASITQRVRILTHDVISDLEVGDRVLYGGDFFKVEAITPDDVNENKQFSKRPRYDTIIDLIN